MTTIGPQYGPPTGPQQSGYPQPVVYRPGVQGVPMMPGAYGAPDSYRPGMPPTGPGMVGAPGKPVSNQPPYEYVAKKDVAFGILGAVGGYFAAGLVGLSGPIGAIILGLALLGMSAITRAVQHNSAKKQQQQGQQPVQGMPQAPNYPTSQAQYQYRYNTGNNNLPPGYQQDPRYRP